MQILISQIKSLQGSQVNDIVEKRLKEFESFNIKNNEAWFSELCFCILAANSKQKTAAVIEKQLSFNKINNMTQNQLAKLIRDNKHRFHNNKSKYIKSALKYNNIKNIIEKHDSSPDSREWLVKNVKGIGYKEASHFLRNTGTKDLAILDRHIINVLSENKIIEKPKTLTPKLYIQIEKKFNSIAKELNISSAKLDLLMWYTKTGEILK